LRERGPLIRSGSTDRAPTRGELDLLYSKNQGGPV
jgi:hypothetical protein